MIEQELIETVIDEVKCDIKLKDMSGLEELLKWVPRSALIQYLPEEVRSKFISNGE